MCGHLTTGGQLIYPPFSLFKHGMQAYRGGFKG